MTVELVLRASAPVSFDCGSFSDFKDNDIDDEITFMSKHEIERDGSSFKKDPRPGKEPIL